MRLVEKVTWDGRKEVPSDPKLSDGVGFWMDTLCKFMQKHLINETAE
jgi:hypothetical protein